MQLTLVLTHACNLRCTYCYTGDKKNVRMSAATGRRAIEFFLAQRPDDFVLAFFGGEPLLEFPLLCELAEYARRRAAEAGIGFEILTTTNGTLLTDDVLRTMSGWPILLCVSVDGTAEAHDATRPHADGSGSHAEVEAGLRRALKTFPELIVNMVVDPANVRALSRSVRWLLELGEKRIRLSMNYYAAWGPEDRAALESEYAAAADLYIERFRSGEPFSLVPFDDRIRMHVKGGPGPKDHCDLGLEELAVAPSGNLYPCERMVNEDTDEKARIGHIDRGFDAERRQYFGGARPGCAADLAAMGLPACGLWCGCTNYLMTGRPDRVPEVFVWQQELTARIAQRIGETLYGEENPFFIGVFYGDNDLLTAAVAERMGKASSGSK